MSIRKEYYTPECHSRLLRYLQRVFPHRSFYFLEYWLRIIRNAGVFFWRKSIILYDGEDIIGCTTAFPCLVMEDGNLIDDCFWEGNTIISDLYRGKGLSRLLYSEKNQQTNWFSVGITDIAWNIQPRLVDNFHPLRPVRVYIGFSRPPLFDRETPDSIRIDMCHRLERVTSSREIGFPCSGRWTTDKYELVRDALFIEERFFNIWRASQYALFNIIEGEERIGYIVVRKICYKKVRLLSVVDFRMKGDNYRLILTAAKELSKSFGVLGFIVITNVAFPLLSFNPLVVRTRKKLHFASSRNGMKGAEMLVTSADSDLDFVYF